MGALAALAACQPAMFPRQLFTIEAGAADYPIMLSQAPAGARGHKIEASSGTRASVRSSSYSTGNATVTMTVAQSAESELSASIKLGAQVGRGDAWVQIDGAEFHADDFAAYGFSSAARQLTIQGTAFR